MENSRNVEKVLDESFHKEKILRAVHYDELTGLPSLAYFFKLAESAKAALLSEGKEIALLYMDLNGMKNFNFRYGFAEGDKLLLAFAEVLKKSFGREKCCHIGADRFTAFAATEGLEKKVSEFLLEASAANGGKNLPVQIGIYHTALGNVPVTTAYDRAKIACDTLRKSNISGFNYYSAEMGAEIRRKQYIQENIDRAIAEKWIRVYYQPIVRTVTEKVCDEEALARWIDPAEGFLSPAEFIPYLEAAGLVYKLDLYVLEQVLEKIRAQQADGLPVVPHSINLSRSDFEYCDMVEEIRKRVDAAGIPRDRITVEVTESVIGSAFEFMKEQVARFRALGFPVWMDDFGSGYSSLDVLQSIRFDLIKFDMSFMRKLNEGDSAKIILTELLKMATALGLDTVCEGVETAEQVHFLQEVGCSKLQGYYYTKPLPYDEILERYRTGTAIGFEDPAATSYYEAIGRVDLYDLGMITGGEGSELKNTFDTLPIAIMEIRDSTGRFVRSNPSYREFFRRSFGMEMYDAEKGFIQFRSHFMRSIIKNCCEQGNRAFYDEKLPNGSTVHSFARRIGFNPANGSTAVAVAVLSVSDPTEEASYADIARALAADYYNIYVVDLETDLFIEYSQKTSLDEPGIERRGSDFFETARRDSESRIYREDREAFLDWFSKEKIIEKLEERGVLTWTYRLIDTGTPVYASMKITRMQGSGNRIILGVSIIEDQVKMQKKMASIQRERDALAKVMAVTEDYISLYSVDPETGEYVEYNATDEYRSLGFAKQGEDFFLQGAIDGKRTVDPEDLPAYLAGFTRENVLREIRENGIFKMHYRLMIRGVSRRVTLKIAQYHEGTGIRLFAGVRAWQERKR